MFARLCSTIKRIIPGDLKRKYLRPHPPLLHPEQGEGMAWLPSFICRATRVEEQKTVLILQKGHVRVAEDDHGGVGEAFLEASAATFFASGVVDHGYGHAAGIELKRLGEV